VSDVLADRSRLNRWGKQKTKYIYRLLKQHVNAFQPACQLRQETVLGPVLAGTPLGIGIPRGGSPGSLLAKLEEVKAPGAVVASQQVGEQEGEDEVVEDEDMGMGEGDAD
jgi:class 3 adenylate cyclase